MIIEKLINPLLKEIHDIYWEKIGHMYELAFDQFEAALRNSELSSHLSIFQVDNFDSSNFSLLSEHSSEACSNKDASLEGNWKVVCCQTSNNVRNDPRMRKQTLLTFPPPWFVC